ncbi:MAG: peptide chain release factor N(5)-glutamine methyltransferase [Paracoccaceae bacterium]
MTHDVKTALIFGTDVLSAADIPNPGRDAQLLLAHAINTDATRLFLEPARIVSGKNWAKYQQHLNARAQSQPISQIIGGREFWGRWFKVTQDVLDPRPETETLIALALDAGPFKRILDLGCGTGILAITLAAEWGDCEVTAVDISVAALDITAQNADLNGVRNRIKIQHSNWFKDISGRYDLIISNPPYIAKHEMQNLSRDVKNWEPHLALTPGGDGLDAYRAIAKNLRQHLAPNGLGIFEIGFQQGASVSKIFESVGYEATISTDLSDHDRVVTVQS